MAQRVDLEEASHPLHEAYACLLSNGLDGAGEALRILVNEASRIERAQHLQTMPYERSAQRVDQANGYKPKTVLTRMGEITFEVPQVRSGGFYPRTRVATLFPNSASRLRLVSAILAEQDEDWMTANIYLTMKP